MEIVYVSFDITITSAILLPDLDRGEGVEKRRLRVEDPRTSRSIYLFPFHELVFILLAR